MAESLRGETVVLAYSGGLDTSAIVPWLIEHEGCEVVAYVADVGQGQDELEGIEAKAIASGARDCIIDDLRPAFVEEVIWPTLRAGAAYEQTYLLGTSMARPIIARGQVEAARRVGASGLCHGCTGKGNDQVRFELTFAALAPDLAIIAPWRTWSFSGREDLLAYCQAKGVPVTSSVEKIYSRDRNLWHVSHEGGVIEDISRPPPDDAWMLTADPVEAPETPAVVRIGFESGVPIALDGVSIGGVELIEALNTLAGEHGVGRVDLVENRVVGMKSRGLYETPAGTVLFAAARALEEIVLDAPSRALKATLGQHLAELIYAGRWWGPSREALVAATDVLARDMTGEVELRLYKGTATATTRSSPRSLYSESIASFSDADDYSQADAGGFLRLFSLPERLRAGRETHQVSQGGLGASG
ncbi:MAG: argininosuccinate synthase [Planctomycetota bacterium]